MRLLAWKKITALLPAGWSARRQRGQAAVRPAGALKGRLRRTAGEYSGAAAQRSARRLRLLGGRSQGGRVCSGPLCRCKQQSSDHPALYDAMSGYNPAGINHNRSVKTTLTRLDSQQIRRVHQITVPIANGIRMNIE